MITWEADLDLDGELITVRGESTFTSHNESRAIWIGKAMLADSNTRIAKGIPLTAEVIAVRAVEVD